MHIPANRVAYDSSRIALHVCYYGCFHLEIPVADFHLKLHKPVARVGNLKYPLHTLYSSVDGLAGDHCISLFPAFLSTQKQTLMLVFKNDTDYTVTYEVLSATAFICV